MRREIHGEDKRILQDNYRFSLLLLKLRGKAEGEKHNHSLVNNVKFRVIIPIIPSPKTLDQFRIPSKEVRVTLERSL